MNKDKIKIVILAAGKGKRMQSESPKVLAKVKEKAMIEHVREAAAGLSPAKPIAVVGHQADLIKSALGDSFTYVTQEEQLGTGHAVLAAKEECKNAEHIVVLQGDMPFISSKTIENLINQHLESGTKITFTTTQVEDFEDWRAGFIAFGRILRKDGLPAQAGKVVGIREYKDASEEEKNIKEVNAGVYVFNGDWLWQNLEKLGNDNTQKEYYLTDLIKLAVDQNVSIESIQIEPHEALGANSKEELDILESFAV